MKESVHEDKDNVECPLCSNCVPCDVFAVHYRECVTKSQKPLKCPYCEWTCPSTSNTHIFRFNQHKKNVHFYGPFRCGECKHVSEFAKGLIEHMSHSHDLSQTICCPSCKDKFGQEEIESHYEKCRRDKTNKRDEKQKELGMKEYKCDKCDMTYRSRRSLLHHQKIMHIWGVFNCLTCMDKVRVV